MNFSEIDAVRERYRRRDTQVESSRYNPLKPEVWKSIQERQRVLIRRLNSIGYTDLSQVKLIEIGCGSGENLLEFLRLGFRTPNLMGIELLENRSIEAQSVLPPGVVRTGDAAEIDIPVAFCDIVYQSVVFSSLLDDAYQEKLATHIWQWVKPGGGVLWYDFVYDNPSNPDVRGVPVSRIRALFPKGNLCFDRLTLAPPISRRVCRITPTFYDLFNLFPFLRTHVLCWISKVD